MAGRFLSLLVLGFALFLAPLGAHANSIHGVMRVVKGDVQITQASDGKIVKGKVGSKVYPKDTITAGKDSRAKIVMIDNNEINVSPDSQVKIDDYQYEPEANKKNVLLNVVYGKVRAKVSQKYDDDKNKFQVKTPSAVAGVRGTDFFTSYDRSDKSTRVVTFEGRVAFGLPGAGGVIRNPVFVNPGETTTVANGAPPAPPVEMPKSELAQMEKSSDAEKAADGPNGGSESSREPAKDKDAKKDDSGEKDSPADKDNGKGNDDKADKRAGNDDGGNKSGNANGPAGTSPAGPSAGGELPSGDQAGGPAPSGDMAAMPPKIEGDMNRMPASTDSLAGGGMMLLPSDMPTMTAPPPIMVIPGADLYVPMLPPPIIAQPTCDFCNAVIESGNTKVNVNVSVGP